MFIIKCVRRQKSFFSKSVQPLARFPTRRDVYGAMVTSHILKLTRFNRYINYEWHFLNNYASLPGGNAQIYGDIIVMIYDLA